MNEDGSKGCSVNLLNKAEYSPLDIFDYRKLENWKPEAFFGLENNKYVRVAQVLERGVPCGIYQAQRTDWPPGEKGITSVWEWCFTDNILPEVELPENFIPLVSLNIYIKESPYTDKSGLKPYKGQQLPFHFYNVRKTDPIYMNLVAFDISGCFPNNKKEELIFSVDTSKYKLQEVLDMPNIFLFDTEWKSVIYKAAGLSESTLRITKVRTNVVSTATDSVLMVGFTLLDRYPYDDGEKENQRPLNNVKASIKAAVDGGQLSLQWKLKEKIFNLPAISGSFGPRYIPATKISKIIQPPALLKAMAEYEKSGKTGGESTLTVWIVGVISLQVGVASGVIGVALKRRKNQQQSLPN